ncbi:MAG: hypothetical protein H8E57_04480 [Candidatus Cloacimonetes bacterium]|nr:hypothetical protein [Candidatus Cloacimonadota bacterium]
MKNIEIPIQLNIAVFVQILFRNDSHGTEFVATLHSRKFVVLFYPGWFSEL